MSVETLAHDIKELMVGLPCEPIFYPDKKRFDFEVGPCLISYYWRNGVSRCSVIDIESSQRLQTNCLGRLSWNEWLEVFTGLEAQFPVEETDEC
jgi:hypothetical protein